MAPKALFHSSPNRRGDSDTTVGFSGSNTILKKLFRWIAYPLLAFATYIGTCAITYGTVLTLYLATALLLALLFFLGIFVMVSSCQLQHSMPVKNLRTC